MTGRKSYRQWLVVFAGAAIYALLYAFCSQIDRSGLTVPGEALPRFALAFPVALCVLIAMFRYVLPALEMEHTEKKFCTWGAWICLLCSYVPMFLIQFPGSYTYDILPQAMQVASETYNETHPILHTLLLRMCVNAYDILGSLERCAALCSVIQMIVVSGCFAGICASLARSVSWLAAVIALGFFAFYPSHMAFASTYTKDVMFSSFFALYLTLHAEAVGQGGLSRRHGALCILSGVVCCMLRSNMIYAMAAWTAMMLIAAAFAKRHLKAALSVLLITVLSVISLNSLKAAVDADGGNIREMLSVPAQQMARVRLLAPHMLTEQECTQMDGLLIECDYTRYDPTIADPIKNCVSNEAFKQDPGAAMRLWFGIGIKCPRIYLDAFLNLALPSLYPYSAYKGSVPYIEVSECRDGLTLPFGVPQIMQPTRFAGIRAWLDEQIFDTGADHHTVIRWMFNTGFVFWLLLLFMLYDFYCGRWDRVLWAMLAVLLWGTYLLGPVMQGRYLYPFICMLPVMVFRQKKTQMLED